MMATVHATASSLIPLLESLEDATAGPVEQTDAYLTIANRLSGEDGKHFLPAVVKHFSRLGKVFQAHIVSPNVELSQAALQALGFCAFHSVIVSGIPAGMVEDILAALNGIVVKSTDKNTCTRALWVISKQNFPSDVVARKVPDVLKTLEAVRAREDLQSVIMEHEALNVVIRLLEQTPNPMGEGAVQWSKLVIPLVVHSASKVRLRAAAALEMGMPLLLRKQQEVAAVIEPLMSSKLIPELQKLFSAKNESNVLKLWPLFVRLLGKLLHRGGPFINSLLHLEELGFRSSSPIIKKIAFIAWKSLIDNFALNPEILCSAKRLKLLMQPLSSIQVRTEMLLMTKLEVWWYLVVRLGPNLAANFEQVGIPLLQIAVSRESPNLPAGTPSRNSSLNASLATPKAGGSSFSSSSSTPRLGLNSSVVVASPAFPSIQLLGLEMLLHYLLGPEVSTTAAKSKLQLSLEPLTHPLITSPSSFSKYASVLISAVRDSLIGIGKDAPDAVVTLVWKNLIGFVTAVMEMAGNKKDKPGSEVLTQLLQALESIVVSEALPAQRTLGLLEATVKGIPRKILGSAAYQVANMDVLNGTPALFLILLFHHSSVLPSFVTDERFFLCLETLIGCGLSGPSSPLAFSESVLGVMSRNAETIQNKEHLWRMWSIVVNPLTDTITQTNEVNQGDALEHNFAAVHCALMFPISHLLIGHVLPQMTQKSLLATWSRLYKAFARCSALVATAEENVCCEELCSKMAAILDAQIRSQPSTLEAVASILLIISECVDFSPYTPHYQKTKSPHTPLGWNRKKNKPLGNLTTFQTLLVQVLESFLASEMTECGGVASGGAATALVSILSTLFSNLLLGTAVLGALSALCAPLARLYERTGRPQNEQPKFFTGLGPKLEKLLGEILGCLQTRSAVVYDDELLALLSPLLSVLFPHRSKQMRTLVSQFWNATFANSPTLTYPEDLKPILSRVKQNMPIILPGFQAVDVPEEFSGQYPADSSESSQFEANLSGVKIASVGKRDSLLSRAGAPGEKASNTPSKPIAMKLDFGSPVRPRRQLLEEEASLDFVFIPPESKERVLTEHQKEVKRTKRVDIPAMYNNLDASLDTTVFTQYTQSQEDTIDKPVANEEPAEIPEKNYQAEVQGGKMKTAEAEPEVEPALEEPVAGKGESSLPLKETEPRSVDIPLKQKNMGAEDMQNETNESIADDCNVSTSSDVVSGTPPKPNSRRQSFITLEKYVEGKSASPMGITKFTGPLSRASNSQDASRSQQKNTDSLVFHEVSANRETEQELGDCCDRQESPHLKEELPEIKGKQHHPQVEEVRKCHPSDGTEVEDEVIPDTQTEVDSVDMGGQETQDSDEASDPTKDEDPYMYDSCEDNYLYDSQCLQVSASQSEIRRSGRRRSRPLRPGEDREEVEGRYQLLRKSSLGKGSQTDAVKADPSPVSENEGYSPGRSSRGTKMPVVQGEEVKKRLRRSRADFLTLSSQMSQNASQSLGRVTRSKAAGPAENALSNTKTTPVGQTARRSLGRSSRSGEGGSVEEISLTKSDLVSSPGSQMDDQSQGRLSRRSKVDGPPEEVSRTDAQNTLSVSQNDTQSQGRATRRSMSSGPSETDSLMSLSTLASQTDSQSQGRPRRTSKASESLDEMSQSGSQKDSSMLVCQSDDQSQSRLSRSKASQPSEEMSQKDLQGSLSTPISQMDIQVKGRLSPRSKALRPSEETSLNETQLSSPTPISQMHDQSKGRLSRKSKAYESLAETSKNDSQESVSTPVHQTDDQMKVRPGRRSKAHGFSKEMSQNEAEANSSTPISQADESQGRPGRRSKASAKSDEMIQNESSDLPASVSQTDSQTDDQLKRRPGRNGKAYESFEEMSQNETNLSLSTPISQMDDQEKGRTGRRRKGSAFTEEMSQSEMQESVSALVNQTDHSLGRVSRRGKASEPSEEMNQNDTPKSTSTPVCQVDNQSQGKSSRSKTSAPSEQASQNELQASSSTPISQTDDQSKGRPGRKSRVSGPSEEMSQNEMQSVSTPVSQIDNQLKSRSRRSRTSQPTEQMSESEMEASLSAPDSQTDDQTKGRPSRSRTSKPSDEMNQNETQGSESTSLSQTDDQSKGRSSRNRTSKLSEEMSQDEMQASESTSPSQMDDQSKGRSSRNRTSKLSEEMSQNEMQASESTSLSQRDDQSKGRSSRKSKTSKSSEETSQNEMQANLSASVSEMDDLPRGIPSRRSKNSGPSVEKSQNDTPESSSMPVSQTADQSKARPSRRSKASKPSEEMSQNETQVGVSTPVSPTDGQSDFIPGRIVQSGSADERSQNELEVCSSTPVGDTDSQSKGRRVRRGKASGSSEELSQSNTQDPCAPLSQTHSQSKGRSGRRSKASGSSEDLSQNEKQEGTSTPLCETDGQSKGRPSRRSRASVPLEEMGQNDSQANFSTPVSQTDSQSDLRLSRTSVSPRSSEEQILNEIEASISIPVSNTVGKPVRTGKASGSSEELGQTYTQEDLSAPLSQTNNQSKGRPGRRSKASGSSEDLSQNEKQEGTSTPLCETDGQSKGRPSRRSRASVPLEEMSQNDAQANFSTPVSQTDSQSDLGLRRTSVSPRSSEEQSLNEMEASISIPVSNTDGKPVRTGKASGSSEELGQTYTQEDLSAPLSQTNNQSKGRPGRRSKVSGPSEEMSQNETEDCSSTPNSQTGSQLRGRRGRRSMASGHSEEVGQNEAQANLITPVSQTDGQSKGRSSRRGKASDPSEVLNQTALELTSSSLGSLTDGQKQGRPRRRSKICDPSEESSQNQIHMGSPTLIDGHSQGEPSSRNRLSEASEEVSRTNKQMSVSASPGEISRTHSKASRKGEEINCLEMNHVSQADSQCQDSLSRTELDDPSAEMSQAVSQIDAPLCVKDDHLENQKDSSQTDSQSLGKQDTRSKSSAELNVSNSLSVTATVRVKEDETVVSFQDFSQLQTGEFSECSVGNSPLEVSEPSEDGRKYGRRGHKRKLSNSEAKPCSPLKTKKAPEISEHIHAQESSLRDGMEDGKNLDPVSISINTNTEGVELSEVQENKHLTEVDAPEAPVSSLVESNMSSMSTSEAFSSVLTEMQRDVLKPLDDPSFEIGDLATNTQKARNKRVCRRPRSKVYDSTTRESPRSEVSSLQGSDSLDSEEIDIESLGHGKTITEATRTLPENSSSQQQNDMGENEVFLEANAASAQSLSECIPVAAAACETEEASRKTVEESSSTDDSKVQADIEASEWAKDFEEGQQLDSDMPGVSDEAEGAVDLAQEQESEDSQEQESEENLDIQGQGMNQKEVFASVQEQNAPKEAAPEELEEDGVAQIGSDMSLEAAGSTAIQVQPEELPAPQQAVAEPLCLDSPLKQKHLDSVVDEVLQSPSSGKTKGVWSPSASPSTSILKKGQKRPLEVESPSPVQKSRRVSFADPIHHQELADDIDRRSPVIRTSSSSSPRSKNTSTGLSQQKFITTPTRGLVTLSPRSLRSPGYKSPKKCLISEMSQERKPIPKDCVFPALVGCSAPVEAVLPQITSNMWPRGFGQLVRARNIKTVGDLSALTPAEIKSLPIRSPKLSSVKKALKNYHDQQRKGRSDELKGFDEMEKMTSEPEETDLTQQQEDVKPSVEPVADAELSDIPVLPPAEPRPVELPSAVEELGARLTQDELGQCSPGQLVLMHEQLGGMMRAIVGQLQVRLTPSPGESLP